MTSIVVSEVHHLPHAPHQHLHDPHLNHHTYRSSSTGPAQSRARSRATSTSTSSYASSSMDTPMTDASRASESTPAQQTSAYSAVERSSAYSSAQNGPVEAPESPRLGPGAQPPQATPRPSDLPQNQAAPSSAPTSSPSPNTPQTSSTSAAQTPAKIKVKSLSHIQSFVLDDENPLSQNGLRRRDAAEIAPQYEISEMPVTDIIEMVAGLLTKITSTNDKQHQHLHRQIPPPEGVHGMSPQTTSVVAFHGKNVPSISILSYLSRIHKYCPTTYEVFLSLLVYFDRMTERVNAGPLQDLRQHSGQNASDPDMRESDSSRHSSVSSAALAQGSPEIVEKEKQAAPTSTTTPPPSGSLGNVAEKQAQTSQSAVPPSPPTVVEPPSAEEPYNFSHFFVVDSFNIHRLVIAGVTCASKFFSDIFYTNSRYAKVGGLPLPELNHLELQFLLLNDFRLAVPLEEMEAYGTMLVEFYAREVVANNGTLSSPVGA